MKYYSRPVTVPSSHSSNGYRSNTTVRARTWCGRLSRFGLECHYVIFGLRRRVNIPVVSLSTLDTFVAAQLLVLLQFQLQSHYIIHSLISMTVFEPPALTGNRLQFESLQHWNISRLSYYILRPVLLVTTRPIFS